MPSKTHPIDTFKIESLIINLSTKLESFLLKLRPLLSDAPFLTTLLKSDYSAICHSNSILDQKWKDCVEVISKQSSPLSHIIENHGEEAYLYLKGLPTKQLNNIKLFLKKKASITAVNIDIQIYQPTEAQIKQKNPFVKKSLELTALMMRCDYLNNYLSDIVSLIVIIIDQRNQSKRKLANIAKRLDGYIGNTLKVNKGRRTNQELLIEQLLMNHSALINFKAYTEKFHEILIDLLDQMIDNAERSVFNSERTVEMKYNPIEGLEVICYKNTTKCSSIRLNNVGQLQSFRQETGINLISKAIITVASNKNTNSRNNKISVIARDEQNIVGVYSLEENGIQPIYIPTLSSGIPVFIQYLSSSDQYAELCVIDSNGTLHLSKKSKTSDLIQWFSINLAELITKLMNSIPLIDALDRLRKSNILIQADSNKLHILIKDNNQSLSSLHLCYDCDNDTATLISDRDNDLHKSLNRYYMNHTGMNLYLPETALSPEMAHQPSIRLCAQTVLINTRHIKHIIRQQLSNKNNLFHKKYSCDLALLFGISKRQQDAILQDDIQSEWVNLELSSLSHALVKKHGGISKIQLAKWDNSTLILCFILNDSTILSRMTKSDTNTIGDFSCLYESTEYSSTINPKDINFDDSFPMALFGESLLYIHKNSTNISVENTYLQSVKLALKKEVSISIIDLKARSPVYLACSLFDCTAVRMLFNIGYKITERYEQGNSPLLITAMSITKKNEEQDIHDALKSCELLIQSGGKVTYRNDHGINLFHISAMLPFRAAIRLLTYFHQYDSRLVNTLDKSGNTPMQWALVSTMNKHNKYRLIKAMVEDFDASLHPMILAEFRNFFSEEQILDIVQGKSSPKALV